MLDERKALVVGINHYDHYPPLTGCVNDATRMCELLKWHGNTQEALPNFKTRLLLSGDYPDKKITRSRLRNEIETFLDSSKGSADVALLYFSGHGYENSLGGYLVTQDARAYEEGFSVNDLLIFANNSKIKEIIILLDCCYSGNVGDFPMLCDGITILRKGITIMTSSQSDKVSLELEGMGGVFTDVLVKGLQGLSADLLGNVKLYTLFDQAHQMLSYYDQTPMLKSNTESSLILRLTTPKIAREDLRLLIELFLNVRQVFRIERLHFEDGEITRNKVISLLKNFLKHGLLQSVFEEEGTIEESLERPLTLTVLGQFYWDMVKKKLI